MDAREQVREVIRTEIAKQNPVEDARRSLELIAETSVRFEGEDSAGYRVIDEHGEPRTRVENGAVVEFTIRDLVADLRDKHATLFQAAPVDAAEALSEAQGGVPHTEGPELLPIAGPAVGSTEAGSAPADVSAREPAMPTAAPFLANLGDPTEKTAAAARENGGSPEASDAKAGPERGPRDWLILDGGKSTTDGVPPGSGPSQSTASQAATGPAGQPAKVTSVAPLAASARASVGQDLTRGRRRPATVAYAVLGGLAVLSTGAYLAIGSRASAPDLLPKQSEPRQTESRQAERARAKTAQATQPPSDPVSTGSVASGPAAEATPARPGPVDPGAITGVPEVIDTATLRIDGKVLRLVGVEWARGGRSDNLTSYLAGREVTCQPAEASEFYRCKVEGRDLSQVVLYNGGGRASPNAPADLLAAENYARSERIGVWQK